MKIEKLIIQIIKDTGLSREEILEMVNELKNKLDKNFSEKLALFMIAEEFCVF